MVTFNDGSVYVRNFEWSPSIPEGESIGTASLEVAHRALIGYKDVQIEVFVNGEMVWDVVQRVWATALSWEGWTFEYPVSVGAGTHDIRFRFTYQQAGDLIENVEGTFEKQGDPPDDPEPPDDPDPEPPDEPEPGDYTLEISAPSSVPVGEDFDVMALACCDGSEDCPSATYTLTLGGTMLVQEDLTLSGGECTSAAVSAVGVSYPNEGTYTIEAVVGDAQATREIEIGAGGSDEPPNESGSNLLPAAVGGLILLGSKGDE